MVLFPRTNLLLVRGKTRKWTTYSIKVFISKKRLIKDGHDRSDRSRRTTVAEDVKEKIIWKVLPPAVVNPKCWMFAGSQLRPSSAQPSPDDYRELGYNTQNMIRLENGTLAILRATEEHEGYYMCEANNGVGAGKSKFIHLVVHGKSYFSSCSVAFL